MAVFDFPASPTVGQQYTPAGGPIYQWNGSAWVVLQGMPSSTHISDTPPLDPKSGQLWWDSDSGNLFVWYVDADSSQWVQVSGMPATEKPTAQTRNRICNPCFQISQEVGNTAVASGGWPADQWTYSTTIAGAGQRTGGVTPNGSVYMLRMNQPTAKPSLAATDFVGLYQWIEGIRTADFQWGTASAKQVVLRLTFYSNKAGTFSFSIINSANNRSYVDTFTIAAGEISSYQTRTFVIPGDVTGTWLKDTGVGLQLWINVVLGSTYTTATKGWQAGAFYGHSSITNNLATAGDFYLGDVGLYLDPLNTGLPPKWQMPDEAEELRACQRYWRTSPMATGKIYNSTSASLAGSFSPAMRSNPAMALSNPTNALNEIGTAFRTITGVLSANAYVDGDFTYGVSVVGTVGAMVTTAQNAKVFVLSARM